MRRRWIAALLAVLSFALLSPLAFGRCGIERWAVKTGTDVDASSVDLSSASPTDVATLRSLQPPSPLPETRRIAPTELTVWVVNATLTVFKLETDQDYHLVLTDASGNTMIVEIPDPACVGSGSPFASAIAQARAKFDHQLSATSQFQEVSLPVQVTGVGFFDRLHNQRGVAPNGIELHPVLDIAFNAGPGPDFAVSASPQTVGISAGGAAALTVKSAASSGFSGPISLSVSGVPSGVIASFNPSTIAGGTGTSSLKLTASSAVSPGAFPLTITASSGGNTHSSNVTLNVAATPGPSPQWEYQLVTANSAESILNQANDLTLQGWELVTVAIDPQRSDRYVAIFRRPTQ